MSEKVQPEEPACWAAGRLEAGACGCCAARQCCSGGSATYAELGRPDAPSPQRGQHCGQLAGWTPGSCRGFQALLLLLCCPLLLSVGVLQDRRRGLTGPSMADLVMPLSQQGYSDSAGGLPWHAEVQQHGSWHSSRMSCSAACK